MLSTVIYAIPCSWQCYSIFNDFQHFRGQHFQIKPSHKVVVMNQVHNARSKGLYGKNFSDLPNTFFANLHLPYTKIVCLIN